MTDDFGKIRNKKYYSLAHKGSKDLSHPAMVNLLHLIKDSTKILDLGCGEGSRLNELRKKTSKKDIDWFGIDINEYAIKNAKKNYKSINFTKGNLEHLPFKDKEFDIIFSSFVFEHLTNPEKVLKESQRVLQEKGKLLIVAPNFGSPNRRSPNSKESKLKKLIKGLSLDIRSCFKKTSSLSWKLVTSRKKDYEIDSDTTIEPYLRSLKDYSEFLGLDAVYTDSLWNMDKFSFFQLPFRVLGLLRVYPFKYWGPHLLIILKKV